MTMRSTRWGAVAMIAVLGLGLAGCAGDSEQEAALDDYVADEAAARESLLGSMADVYEDYTVEAQYPDTVVYSYHYLDGMDVDATAAALDDQLEQLEASVREQVFPIMAEYGVEPTQGATFEYYDNDGSLIWSHSFSSED